MAEETGHDLIGSPFSVIESDPGVFTSLIGKLGVQGLEVLEIYGIEPWDMDHLNPHGLVFCYLCTEDNDHNESTGGDDELEDRDAQRVWFANQLSDDACASQAILNVLLNCPDINIGDNLRDFHAFTDEMSPVMRGLAISNSQFIREAQNSLARPADIRGSLHAAAAATIETNKSMPKKKHGTTPQVDTRPSTAKKRKTASSRAKRATESADEKVESYHFIGYVCADNKVWELDGLRKYGPLEVGEVDGTGSWMDVVRPALRMRMEKYLRSAGEGEHIRFNLLAIVEDPYQKASDELEMFKRERTALERRMNEAFPTGWNDKVDPELLASSIEAFATSVRPPSDGPVFSCDFGSRKMDKELAILELPSRKLPGIWEECMRNAMSAKTVVEDEITRSKTAHTEHISRTFDYDPFIREFVTCMHKEELLEKALNQTSKTAEESTGEKPKTPGKRAKKKR